MTQLRRTSASRRRTAADRSCQSGSRGRGLPALAVAASLVASLVLASSALAATAKVRRPAVSTGAVSELSYSSVTLNGDVNARGSATNYAFQYGSTSGYASETPLADAGAADVEVKVSDTITGLSPDTTYHYRLIAGNAAGQHNGVQRTFKTPAIPLSVTIAGIPNPVVFGSPFVVEGTLAGTEAASHEVVLEADTYPYPPTGFTQIGYPVLTDSTGGFSFPAVGIAENTELRVVTVGGKAVMSPVIVESVAVRVTFHAHRTRRRGYYRLYGNVTPSEAGALVGFQLLKPGHDSINEGGTVVTAAGTGSTYSRFSRVVHIRHPGLYRALVKIDDLTHVYDYSYPITIH